MSEVVFGESGDLAGLGLNIKQKRGRIENLKPFVKGKSGNPKGRPKVPAEVKEILKAASPEAARRLVELARGRNQHIALKAAVEILDRTQGRPEVSGRVSLDCSATVDLRAEVRALLLEHLRGIALDAVVSPVKAEIAGAEGRALGTGEADRGSEGQKRAGEV